MAVESLRPEGLSYRGGGKENYRDFSGGGVGIVAERVGISIGQNFHHPAIK